MTKFNDTVLQAGGIMRHRVNWFNTGTERDTYKWCDRECIAKKRHARRALNRFKRTNSDADKLSFREKRMEYKSTMKDKKKQQALFDNKRNNSKFWGAVR